jgi:hypothetical protein
MKTIVCKKDYISHRTYRKNKKYIIYVRGYQMNDDNCFILTDEYTNDRTEIKGLWFGPQFGQTITEYFYSEKELRQKKLKQLKEINI